MNRRALAVGVGTLLALGILGAAERYQQAHELGSMRVHSDPPGLKYVLSEPDDDRGWYEGRLIPRKSDGTLRIVCLGDSVTYGVSVSAAETWCADVRRGLGVKAEAYNFGMNGYDAEQVATLLTTRIAAWNPDVVVWGTYVNDVFPTYLLYGQESGTPVFVGTDVPEQAKLLPEALALLLVHHSALFRAVQGGAYARSESRAGPRAARPGWYGEQVAKVTAWSRDTKVPVVVLAIGPHALSNMGTCPQQFPVAGLCEASAAQYASLTAELTAQAVAYVDGLAAFQASGRPHYHPPGRLDPDHPNAAGHRVLATAVLPAVRAVLGVERTQESTPPPDAASDPPPLRDASGARVRGGGRRGRGE